MDHIANDIKNFILNNVNDKQKSPGLYPRLFSFLHAPTHEVVPNAVTIAVAMVAIRCTMNLIVSFFDIVLRI